MSVAADITQILTSGGNVRGLDRGSVRSGSSLVQRDLMNRVEPLCWDATVTINVPGNSIVVRAVPLGTVGANAVMIGNASEVAAAGQLSPPGFIYSDFFSGCLFYLFRDAHGSVYGVHAYRASGTYPDPMPHFNRLGATLLYFFNSGGQFTAMGMDVFGSVICHVTNNKIVIDFFAMRNDGTVVAVVDHQRIDNWRAAPAIPAPAIGGAMPQWTRTVMPPAQMGLKKRVAKFLLNYH